MGTERSELGLHLALALQTNVCLFADSFVSCGGRSVLVCFPSRMWTLLPPQRLEE